MKPNEKMGKNITPFIMRQSLQKWKIAKIIRSILRPFGSGWFYFVFYIKYSPTLIYISNTFDMIVLMLTSHIWNVPLLTSTFHNKKHWIDAGIYDIFRAFSNFPFLSFSYPHVHILFLFLSILLFHILLRMYYSINW